MTGVTITLTAEQISEIQERVAITGEALRALSGMSDPERFAAAVAAALYQPEYSQSTLRAMLVLSAIPADGTPRELREVASEIGLPPATIHRYLRTWLVVGVLERDSDSRRYRRAVPQQNDSQAGAGNGSPPAK
jgi:IclR-like helix-turn-helix domain-containing protein